MRPVFRSLRGQTFFAVVTIHLIVFPAFFAALIFFVHQAFAGHFVQQIRSEVRFLAAQVPELPTESELHRVFYEATLGSPLVRVEVLDTDGEVQWSHTGQLGGREVPPFREDFFFGGHGDDLYFISTPVEEGSQRFAKLRLAFDERPTRAQIAMLYRRGALVTLGYLLLTLGLAAWWIHRLNKPIRRLSQSTRLIASGQVREPMLVDSGVEEIRSLAADIDHMRRELLKKTDSMEYLAMHDSLTGLPNRALLADRVRQTLARADRHGQPVALILIDLDHFKEVNDTLGHSVGDQLLRMVPERLSSCLREADTLARLGGDEFAFLLPDTDVHGAINVIDRLTDSMRPPFRLQGQNLHLGMSMGVALYPEHATDFEGLFRQADIAMYAAKHERQEYMVFSPDIDPHSRDRLALASELRRDLEAGILEVHYQPQIRLSDGAVCAVEALARWPHPERGLIPPEHFIPMADRLGLMQPLTTVVLQQAIAEYARNENLKGLELCINLAASNVHDPELPKELEAILAEHGVSPENVVLEITEHEYMSDPAIALRQLSVLRDAGFGLAIDDFGTGHSSFEYLKHLPVTEVKIDKSFVTDLTRDRHDYSLVAAIIALGQKMDLSVVAEGVQDQATLDQLKQLNCDRAQGFHIAKPMPAEELAAYFATRKAGA